MSDQEFIDWLRVWLGVDESIIDDTVLQFILDMVQNQYPDSTDCRIKYEFTKATLEYLIRTGAVSQGSNKAFKRIKEKNSRREVEHEFTTSDDALTGWDRVLDDLINDPTSIGCNPFEDVVASKVIIGAGDKTGVEEVYSSRRRRDDTYCRERFNSRRWRY